MTIMVNYEEPMVKTRDGWSVATAKAHWSKLIDRALAAGPQWITRRGRQVAVIVSAEGWHRKTARKARREFTGRPMNTVDALLAGTATVFKLQLATRNTADFDDTGVELFDPWMPRSG